MPPQGESIGYGNIIIGIFTCVGVSGRSSRVICTCHRVRVRSEQQSNLYLPHGARQVGAAGWGTS
ncbi:MAG: hypothetical protein J1E33_01455 [Alistipes sp.]|nr:hypothetical protein [Alistipes sp.]